MTTRTRLPFRLLSPEGFSAAGSPDSAAGSPLSPAGVSLVPPPQPASRPTAMEADRSRAISFLNFIVQSFLSFLVRWFWVRGESRGLLGKESLHYRAYHTSNRPPLSIRK